jgi:hypothetical protein
MKVNAPENIMIRMNLTMTEAWIGADDLRRAADDFAQHGETCGISMQQCFDEASRAPHGIIVNRDAIHAMRAYLAKMIITAPPDLLDALFTRRLIAGNDRKKRMYQDTARVLTVRMETPDRYTRVCFEMWQASRTMIERHLGLNLGDDLGTFYRIEHQDMPLDEREKASLALRL